jgi:hypothetical protein
VNPPSVAILDTLGAYSLTTFGVAEDGELYLCLLSGEIMRFPPSFPTSAGADAGPAGFGLEQNYPNPFNGETRIRLSIPEAGTVTVRIFDAVGREVDVLVRAGLAPGVHALEWNSGDLPTGVYFYDLAMEGQRNQRKTRRMLLLR